MSINDKLLVVVAPCIPPYMAQNVPGLDLSPEGIADEVLRAYNAGANAVQTHLSPFWLPTMADELFDAAVEVRTNLAVLAPV